MTISYHSLIKMITMCREDIIIFIDRIIKVTVESKIKYIRIINIEKNDIPCFNKDSINTKPAI